MAFGELLRHTIKSNLEVNSLFREAERSVQKNLIVLIAEEIPERDHTGRVAYLAGRRLGSAPERNRAKRRLRTAARLEGAPWEGLRVVLVAREACLDAEFARIRQDIQRGLGAVQSRLKREKPSAEGF